MLTYILYYFSLSDNIRCHFSRSVKQADLAELIDYLSAKRSFVHQFNAKTNVKYIKSTGKIGSSGTIF